jgi:hypothetical protein
MSTLVPRLELKEDLSHMKEEDPDYKFLNYIQEKSMGRQAEKEALSWESHFFDDVLPCGLETGPADGSAFIS